ncbi:chemokine-like factor isoform X2 [Peromyscus maniculatus bairdii]|uniref:chemokine-like factor isoform X2 n=1 Tax=Peromyscus maniculatus bairdii TaxID=230844 RepID=UPI00042AB39E|nr:chemokine-like factor isoform X2 [Peromyscus maniculatus bairdii]XP_028740201.1 chemokine-like factor isoform X3 [Peromyscus leucopus]
MESEEQDVEQPFCLSVKGLVKMLRLDITNSMVATLFMLVVSVLALIPKPSTMTILGGVFGLLTAVCAIADCALVYRKLLLNPSGPYRKRSPDYSKDESQ